MPKNGETGILFYNIRSLKLCAIWLCSPILQYNQQSVPDKKCSKRCDTDIIYFTDDKNSSLFFFKFLKFTTYKIYPSTLQTFGIAILRAALSFCAVYYSLEQFRSTRRLRAAYCTGHIVVLPAKTFEMKRKSPIKLYPAKPKKTKQF